MIRIPHTSAALVSLCALAGSSLGQVVSDLDALFADQHAASISLEGRTLVLFPEHRQVHEQLDAVSVRGRVGEDGTFVVARGPAGIEGGVWMGDRVYTIRGSHAGGAYEILPYELDQVGAGCGGALEPGVIPPAGDAAAGPSAQIDRRSRGGVEPTRVLVVYNEDAQGDVSDINAYIAAMIASANEAYENSVTDVVEIELAGAYLLDEQFSDDFGTVLRQVTNRHDGVGDTMHSLRDATDADVIAMLVDQPGYCGIAWLAPGNTEYAMSVSDTDCALGNLTFAHELGHNQGCAHDPDNSGSSSAPYGYGHRWNNDSTRSVMAYSPGTRVPHFSNPDVLQGGFPTGIANERDNARVLDETHDAMSTMRLGDGSGIDEDGDSVTDRLQIALDPGLDMDRDGRLDSVQIGEDPSLDCNGDGLIDAEQVFPRVRVMVGTTTEFGSGIEPMFSTGTLPVTASDVTIDVGIVGDIGESDELLTLEFNGGLYAADVYAESFVDCYAPGAIRSVSASSAQFAQILDEGIDLRVVPSFNVGADVCSSPNLTIWVEYRTHDLSLDADGDGIIDSCACPADLSGDGDLNFFDVTMFIQAYNSQDPAADFNGDGTFDFFDVTAFIVAFNDGCP